MMKIASASGAKTVLAGAAAAARRLAAMIPTVIFNVRPATMV
jgi:hypothetical protein